MPQGYVHVYTGNGKGKTTAALGLALRAVGAGHRVFIAQFAKGMDSSESRAFARLSDRVVLRQFGLPHFVRGQATPADVTIASLGLREVESAVHGGEYDMVVLDEANVAVKLGLLPLDWLLQLIVEKPEPLELVITGKAAHPRLIEIADLVTEMREVKHYFRRGVLARIGVDM
jgi:cob(I)alamin adenosyltransferase